MKLIIDIPDNEYKYTCERTLHDRTMWDNAIRNGIPLDDVKAEIKKMPTDYCGGYIGLDKNEVLNILDNVGRK